MNEAEVRRAGITEHCRLDFRCEPKAERAEVGEIPPGEAVDRLSSTVPE